MILNQFVKILLFVHLLLNFLFTYKNNYIYLLYDVSLVFFLNKCFRSSVTITLVSIRLSIGEKTKKKTMYTFFS